MSFWKNTITKLQAVKRDIPKLAANEMANFSLDNIRKGSWEGVPFAPRDPQAERNSGRAILVDTGEGRRSIEGRVRDGHAVLTSNEYMHAHNTGVNKRVNVRSHTRVRNGRSETVSSFTRQMNLPKRQFSGKSEEQSRRISKVIVNRIINAFS